MEIDGSRILIDPFWGNQAGPSSLIGTKPFYPAPAALSAIGPVDAVLISHDHWDHLDQSTVSAMVGWPATVFVVPLGIGAHLERWGIPSDRIRELDWWQSAAVGSVELVSTPARHNSGRSPLRSNQTLWSGWALRGPEYRVWYSGDSGYFPDLEQIGERLGPFDVTLIESGQYDKAWPDDHLGPELAVHANALVGGDSSGGGGGSPGGGDRADRWPKTMHHMTLLPPGQRRVDGFPRFGTHLHHPPPTPTPPACRCISGSTSTCTGTTRSRYPSSAVDADPCATQTPDRGVAKPEVAAGPVPQGADGCSVARS